VSASKDSLWCFYDISPRSCLTQVTSIRQSHIFLLHINMQTNVHDYFYQDDEALGQEGYTFVSFHPDGLILGT
jgi:hypothetical protein